MPWFAVPVVFSIAAPTEEAASLLAKDQHAGELQELLDYPDVAVAALGEDVDADGDDGGLDRYLVAVTVTLDAGDQRAARSVVDNAVAEADVVQHDFREIRDPSPASDPRLLAEETKRAIDWANDILGDQLREDAAALRAGEKFEDLTWLDQYLPSCFAREYDADLVERFIKVVNGSQASSPATPTHTSQRPPRSWQRTRSSTRQSQSWSCTWRRALSPSWTTRRGSPKAKQPSPSASSTTCTRTPSRTTTS